MRLPNPVWDGEAPFPKIEDDACKGCGHPAYDHYVRTYEDGTYERQGSKYSDCEKYIPPSRGFKHP